jgi:nucleotide-binding universal stress UspA family protein
MVILCGVDDSAAARQAAIAGAAVAKRAGEELELLHVQDVLLASAGAGLEAAATVPIANQALLDAERTRLEGLLEPLRAELARDFGVRVELRFDLGYPVGELARRARELAASLLFLGAVGRRSGSMWRLGSIPDRLSQAAPVPVMVVRDGAPMARWAVEARPLRIILALGTSSPSVRAAEVAGALARIGPCEIIEAHVYHPELEARRLGLSTRDERETRLAIEADLGRRLPGRSVDGVLGARFVAIPSRGHVAEALAELAEQERADCVVAGARGRGALERRFLGSVSYGLLGLCNTNVLVARESEATRGSPPAHGRRVVIERVLAATDLSESGRRALDYGLALLPNGGQLTLLHVLVRPLSADMVPVSNAWGPGAEERRMERAMALAELNKLVPEGTGTVEVLAEVAEAIDVQHGVLEAAERHAADVVVLGRRGRGGVIASLMGSSARAVAGRSPRPVLVVPEVPEDA